MCLALCSKAIKRRARNVLLITEYKWIVFNISILRRRSLWRAYGCFWIYLRKIERPKRRNGLCRHRCVSWATFLRNVCLKIFVYLWLFFRRSTTKHCPTTLHQNLIHGRSATDGGCTPLDEPKTEELREARKPVCRRRSLAPPDFVGP